MPGSDALLSREVLRIGEAFEARQKRGGEGVRIVDRLGQVGAQGLGRWPALGDERDGARGDLAAGSHGRSGGGGERSSRTGVH